MTVEFSTSTFTDIELYFMLYLFIGSELVQLLEHLYFNTTFSVATFPTCAMFFYFYLPSYGLKWVFFFSVYFFIQFLHFLSADFLLIFSIILLIFTIEIILCTPKLKSNINYFYFLIIIFLIPPSHKYVYLLIYLSFNFFSLSFYHFS